ncbi:hypothetical protein L1286_08750 [Pseudoalteromonas sp. SMS1]|uniref:hypothetical protein n=1 Tax=Pseudoalteromonas sp. SMS1 TaxID=2908894 RepID=UPI001F18556D|nr:hypothetical protein [Pseudoalteromonas sp. SMS1]MCF2857556.1 hypothetical protein [Pseudoalteromonas sp. SMS1]
MSLPMEKFALRRVFYFSKLVIMASFMATLYILHSIRGCLFSRVAKSIGYLAMFSVSLHMMQLVARGYFDFNGLSPLYQFSVMVINIMAFMVIAIYSIKLMIKTKFDSYKELVK